MKTNNAHKNQTYSSSSYNNQPDIQTVTISALQKINPKDRFPCYACFDHPLQKINCPVCEQRGYINGDHPMVKFVDDYLTQNLTSQLKLTNLHQRQSCVNDSNSSDQEFLQKRALTKRTQCRSALASYQIRDSQTSNDKPATKMLSSLNNNQDECIHIGYRCDVCQSQSIRGYRYHCKVCQDFDMCRKCYLQQQHEHQMQQIAGKKKRHLEQSKVLQANRRSIASKTKNT